jgi:hypothetical protein
MTPRRKTDTLYEAQNLNEAMDYMWAGLKYFLIHHTKKTVIVVLLISGSSLYVVFDYVTSTKAKVFEAKPIGTTMTFHVQPSAIAAPLGGEPIVINGKTYGYYDPTLEVWKEAGSDRFLVHNKVTGEIKWVEVQDLRKSLK